MLKKILLAISVSGAALLGGTALSQAAESCSFNVSPMHFGQIDTLSGGDVLGAAAVNVSCAGGMPMMKVLVCPALNAGTGGADSAWRRMQVGTNELNYQLYTDAARTQVWGSTTWPYGGQVPGYVVTLGSTGTGAGTFPIYGKVPGGQSSTVPGSYLSSFSSADVEFRYRVTSGTDCSTATGNIARPSFNVTAQVAENCLSQADDLVFGSGKSAVGEARVRCTPGTPYSVGLNGGLSGRIFGNGATYGLFRDSAHSQTWGNTLGTDTVLGSGTGSWQSIPVYGSIAEQTITEAGDYTDPIVVTTTYGGTATATFNVSASLTASEPEPGSGDEAGTGGTASACGLPEGTKFVFRKRSGVIKCQS
jgi:spore coat protein U-like protein